MTRQFRNLTDLCNGTNITDSFAVSPNSDIWRTLMAVYLGAILFLSLTFNGTLCLLFYKKTHLLSISNCFVLNLTACQLCMSMFLLPFSLFAMVSQNFEYAGTLCNVQGFLLTVLIVTQQLALLVISIDRNYAIMYSLRYPNVFTPTLCMILISFSWLFAIVMSVPPLSDSGMGRYTFHRTYYICTLDWTSYSWYLVSFAVIIFGIPISIQSLCYIRIFIAAVGHTKRTAKVNPLVSRSSRQTSIENESSSNSVGSTEGSSSSMECKAVRTIFIIALAFVTCWVPYFVESIMALRGNVTNPTFSAAVICFLFSTGILNPLIYAFMNRVTRREIGRFVCSSSSSNDSDEFVSTSMSTHTSNWSSQNSKFRSRSFGVTNNDMHTIIEENEDSSVFTKDIPKTPESSDMVKIESKPQKKTSLAHTEKITIHTDTHTARNSTEIMVEATNSAIANVGDDVATKPSTSKDKTVTIGKARVFGDSHWKIVNTERFKEEKRRSSSKPVNADMYFSKQRRRTKRDCGSFLFFEHNADQLPSMPKTKRVKQRPERFSVDHVQSVSLGKFPTFMKLKLSLNDTDLQAFDKVTVQSNIEIENKSYKGKSGSDNEKRSPGTSSTSSNNGSPATSATIYTTQWQENETVDRKVSTGSRSRKNSRTRTVNNDTVANLAVPCVEQDNNRDRFRERCRSEPFLTGLQTTPPMIRSPIFNEPNPSPHKVPSESKDGLDQYLD